MYNMSAFKGEIFRRAQYEKPEFTKVNEDFEYKRNDKSALLMCSCYHTTGFLVGITNDNITSCVLDVKSQTGPTLKS